MTPTVWLTHSVGLAAVAAAVAFLLRRQAERERRALFGPLDALAGPPARGWPVRFDPRRVGPVTAWLLFTAAVAAWRGVTGGAGTGGAVVGWAVFGGAAAAAGWDVLSACRAPAADDFGPPRLLTAPDRIARGVTGGVVLSVPVGRDRRRRRFGPAAGAALGGACAAAALWAAPGAPVWPAALAPGLLSAAVLVRRVRGLPTRATALLTDAGALTAARRVRWEELDQAAAAPIPAGPLAGGVAVELNAGGRAERFLVAPDGVSVLNELLAAVPPDRLLKAGDHG